MILGLSKQQFQSMWARVFALYPGAEDLRMTDRYLEDFAVGQTYGSGRFQIDEKRIKSFASEFDPQPFHLDAAAAQRTMFQGLVASGWHTAAVTMRLLVESELRPAGGIVGAGLDELRWPRPVRPGDELNIRMRSSRGAAIEVASGLWIDQGADDNSESESRGGIGVGGQSAGVAAPEIDRSSRILRISMTSLSVAVARAGLQIVGGSRTGVSAALSRPRGCGIKRIGETWSSAAM
jgi:acyl dehydratase